MAHKTAIRVTKAGKPVQGKLVSLSSVLETTPRIRTDRDGIAVVHHIRRCKASVSLNGIQYLRDVWVPTKDGGIIELEL